MKLSLAAIAALFAIPVLCAGTAGAAATGEGTPVRAAVLEGKHLRLAFDDTGRVVSLRSHASGKEALRLGNPGKGFEATVLRDGQPETWALPVIAQQDDTLIIGRNGLQVTLKTTDAARYRVFRIADIAEPAGLRIQRLSFQLAPLHTVVVHALDYMTRAWSGADVNVWFDHVWARSGGTDPLGSFALYLPENDEDADETLLHLWANEGLPHPKVVGPWTVERARTWLRDWQARFVDQSTMILKAEGPEELYRMTDYAASLGMKKVYLHTDMWRGEYWPVHNSFLHVNRTTFPDGEPDFRKWADYCRNKGMNVAIHLVSCAIGRFDPDYVRPTPDPRLAGWAQGTLVEPVDEQETAMRFRPDEGIVFPREMGHGWAGPGNRRSWMRIDMVQIGSELVQVSEFRDTDTDVWTLRGCRRGGYETRAAAYPAGTRAKGLYRPYGQAFTADSNTDLLDEVARRYCEFCNRMGVTHMECDGLEIHADVPWGPAKFAWKVAENLDHPVTSNTSNGRPLLYQIEYWFKSSAEVWKNHATGGVAGGDGVPLYLDHDYRDATGPYEILLKPTQRLGMGGRTFNFMRPKPMFGVSDAMLDVHGLSTYIAGMFSKWQQAARRISPRQVEQIGAWFSAYRSPFGQARNQRATDMLMRPEEVNDDLALVPLRLLGRVDGEMNWGWGQEYGPLVPRQYLKPGQAIEVENPWDAQEPEFVIRVMPALKTAAASAGTTRVHADEGSIVDAYNRGAGQSANVHPLSDAKHLWAPEFMDKGEARASSTCAFRKTFLVDDPAQMTLAAAVFHVDDSAKVFVNGKKVFVGGRFDKVLMLDLGDKLTPGENTIGFLVTNGGPPGCFTGAIILETAERREILSGDVSWRCSGAPPETWTQPGFDDSAWSNSFELARFGESVWPRAVVEPASMTADLMPDLAKVGNLGQHTITQAGSAIRIRRSNGTVETIRESEGFPQWRVCASMEGARGIGMTVTGDGSGALLVLTVQGRGQRDYVVKVDFEGPRDIEIPCGQAAWSDPSWAWHGRTRSIHYGNITQVSLGLATIPPGTEVDILVAKLRVLAEVESALEHPRVAIGQGVLEIMGTVPNGRYLWFTGGDTLGVYDLNWQKLQDLPVAKDNFIAPKGQMTISVENGPAQSEPWLECQFVVKDQPIMLEKERKGREARDLLLPGSL